MNKFVLTATVLLLSSPAVAQSATEKTGVNSLIGVAPTTEDSSADLFR